MKRSYHFLSPEDQSWLARCRAIASVLAISALLGLLAALWMGARDDGKSPAPVAESPAVTDLGRASRLVNARHHTRLPHTGSRQSTTFEIGHGRLA